MVVLNKKGFRKYMVGLQHTNNTVKPVKPSKPLKSEEKDKLIWIK